MVLCGVGGYFLSIFYLSWRTIVSWCLGFEQISGKSEGITVFVFNAAVMELGEGKPFFFLRWRWFCGSGDWFCVLTFEKLL